jgi:chemotaxis protein CheD
VRGPAPGPGAAPRSPALAPNRIYLHPGQIVATGQGVPLSTILGSCVGVCLHDPGARVGGLNHYLLPRAPAGQTSPRYGDVAVRQLVREVERIGGERMRLVATLAGGACVLDVFRGRSHHLGRSNVEIARLLLGDLGVTVVAEHVGGTRGRRVTFDPVSGDVTVRVL